MPNCMMKISSLVAVVDALRAAGLSEDDTVWCGVVARDQARDAPAAWIAAWGPDDDQVVGVPTAERPPWDKYVAEGRA